MPDRIALLPIEEALRAGRELGVTEAQASRGAFRMLAHNPGLAKQVYALLTTLMTRNKLPVRLRELIVMRIAWTTGSEYAWVQHYRIATTQAGLSADSVVAIRDWRTSECWAPAERAVLAAVDDTIGNGKISDAVWAQCAVHIREPALLVEMVVAIGNWIMFSQIFQTLQVRLQDGAPAWPPDGKSPA
jgi:alkylhydroperoxidase family enzyme